MSLQIFIFNLVFTALAGCSLGLGDDGELDHSRPNNSETKGNPTSQLLSVQSNALSAQNTHEAPGQIKPADELETGKRQQAPKTTGVGFSAGVSARSGFKIGGGVSMDVGNDKPALQSTGHLQTETGVQVRGSVSRILQVPGPKLQTGSTVTQTTTASAGGAVLTNTQGQMTLGGGQTGASLVRNVQIAGSTNKSTEHSIVSKTSVLDQIQTEYQRIRLLSPALKRVTKKYQPTPKPWTWERLVGFYEGNRLVKLEQTFGEEGEVSTLKYFFKNSELFFLVVTFKNHKDENVPTTIERLYFHNGKIVKALIKQAPEDKLKTAPNTPHTAILKDKANQSRYYKKEAEKAVQHFNAAK